MTVKASCTGGGTFATNPLPVDPANPAVFDYSGFTGTPTCTALESNRPAGYATDNSDCQDGDALDGECTLYNFPLVQLDNNDRLGDAGIFQYYTVNNDWQTFVRVINTSDHAVSVKVRFLEAANSREVLDYIIFLSPFDMWSGWTDADATGTGNPGVRTLDTSCLYPALDNNNTSYGWKTVDANLGLLGADFSDAAFTDLYADNSGKSSLQRMSEGHVEIIGIAEHEAGSTFTLAVSHDNATGKPSSCTSAIALWEEDATADYDLPNVLAFNGYLINVQLGQGAGL